MKVSHTNTPGFGWQIIGELDLKFETGTEERILPWLAEVLRPFGLHQDFLGRIQRSVKDAVRRIRQLETGLKPGHGHLMIYRPEVDDERGNTWGYFEIDKIEGPADDPAVAAHVIEFYLYQEGKEERDSS